MKPLRVPRELANYKKDALARGWRIEPAKGRDGGHLRWIPPDGQFIITGGAHGSADPRASKNAIARLRKAGLTGGGKPNGRKS